MDVDQDVDQTEVFYWSTVDVMLTFSSLPIFNSDPFCNFLFFIFCFFYFEIQHEHEKHACTQDFLTGGELNVGIFKGEGVKGLFHTSLLHKLER